MDHFRLSKLEPCLREAFHERPWLVLTLECLLHCIEAKLVLFLLSFLRICYFQLNDLVKLLGNLDEMWRDEARVDVLESRLQNHLKKKLRVLADGAGHGLFALGGGEFLRRYCQLLDQITNLPGDVKLLDLLIKDLRVALILHRHSLLFFVRLNLQLFGNGRCWRGRGSAVDQ